MVPDTLAQLGHWCWLVITNRIVFNAKPSSLDSFDSLFGLATGLQRSSQRHGTLDPEVWSVQHLLPEGDFFASGVHPRGWSSGVLS